MDTSKTELLAYHGWGLKDTFWDPWKKFFPSDINMRCANRGYFGESSIKEFRQKNSNKIIMLHSFGLHWCPENLIRQASHLIIFSGFLDFHPNEPDARRRSKLVLQQMMARFIEEPEETIEKFYDNLFHPEPRVFDPPFPMNHERLLEDLNQINNRPLPLKLLQEIPSIIILHGEEDSIVSNTIARTMYHRLRFQSQYFEIKQAGHALPYTHPRQCFQLIMPKLQVSGEGKNV